MVSVIFIWASYVFSIDIFIYIYIFSKHLTVNAPPKGLNHSFSLEGTFTNTVLLQSEL